jgi:molecular chaperone DnaK
MSRTTIDFGIDLGTTNSTIAVIDGVDTRIIPNKVGSTTTPSAVWVDKRGSVHVGQEAKLRALQTDPDNADLEFKLRMGLGAEGRKVFANGGLEMLPEQLSAEVLKSLKLDVQSSLGEEMRSAVITVPAAFENPQTSATQKAAELAGFVRGPLVLEPVAASLAYGFQSQSENVYWLVYDFGGGTFDAAVMRIRDGLIQVVSHDGDNYLGGKLLDWDIVTACLIPALQQQYNLGGLQRGNPRWKAAIGKLKYHAEQAKIDVCRGKASCEIWIENLCTDDDGKDVDFAYTLTPQDVEKVGRPYIERSLDLCRNTLRREGLTGVDMERVLLVGGTTLNPWLREAVASELGCTIEHSIDPITVVARGAAIFASTRQLAPEARGAVAKGAWDIQIEHKPVGNVKDPDIGGRITPPAGGNVDGCTVEFVDKKTQWRSGRIKLDSRGIFFAQLFAEERRRCEYTIELCDPTGSRLDCSPAEVVYTVGVVPEENPPAAMTIGVGLANGDMKPYVAKGAKLPVRKSMDHYTTVALRAGHGEDELRIPLLEGEHARATRNHGIGTLTIKGSDIRRDLPSGSQIEITVIMDESQQVRVQAYVAALDEEFEVRFDPKMQHESIEELRKNLEAQKNRLARARNAASDGEGDTADKPIARVDDQQLVEHLDQLADMADQDSDAVVQLDRKLRELAAAVDQVEDALEWPTLCAKAEESRKDTENVVEKFGETADRTKFTAICAELDQAVAKKDAELVRKYAEDLDDLWHEVLDRQVGWHVQRFNWLVERAGSMQNPGQAEILVSQGRRAINNNDVAALKAANRQLLSLLPRDVQTQASDPRIGGTMTMD